MISCMMVQTFRFKDYIFLFMEISLAKYEIKMLAACSSYKGWCHLAEQTKGCTATINHRQDGTDGRARLGLAA